MNENNRLTDPITISTIIIALATVANVGVSGCLWLSTRESADIARRTYEAGNRPYIGVAQFTVNRNAERRSLQITANVRNFGTSPAQNVTLGHEPFLNGNKFETSVGNTDDAVPFTFYPTVIIRRSSFVFADDYDAVIGGKSRIDLTVHASYDGASNQEHYTYCEQYRYDHLTNSMSVVGTCQQPTKP